MAALLTGAGFARARSTDVEVSVSFAGADAWRAWSASHGQLAMWESVPAGERDHVLAAAARHLDAPRGADGRATLTQHVRLTVAER